MNNINNSLLYDNLPDNSNLECLYCHIKGDDITVSLTLNKTIIMHFCNEAHMCYYLIASDDEALKMYGYEQLSSIRNRDLA